MAKPRILDINEIAYGSEPEADVKLATKLNWYSAASNIDDKKKWAIKYFTARDVELANTLSTVDKQWFATVGSLCRILSRGGVLGLIERQSFNKIVKRIVDEHSQVKVAKVKVIKVNKAELEIKYKPLDDLYEQLDTVVDLVIEGAGKYSLPVIEDGLSNVWIVETSKYYKEQQDELVLVLNGVDADLVEGYSFSKSKLKRLIKLYSDIEDLLNQYLIRQKNLKSISRKPRKVKSKSKSKLIEKLHFMKSDKVTNIVSFDPIRIIDSKVLFVYNTKTRKLFEYFAEDDSIGLNIKGSTLTGFSSKSYCKTIRKPKDFFASFMAATVFRQSKQLNAVKSTEGNVTGRINKDCILISCK